MELELDAVFEDVVEVPEGLELLPLIASAKRDLRKIGAVLEVAQARELVRMYYDVQKLRIGSGNASVAMAKQERAAEVVEWLTDSLKTVESGIKGVLDVYSKTSTVGQWARMVPGIGPVLASALLSEIDIEKAPSAGHIWAFAGLDPTTTWERGEKRPFNGFLKTVAWKIGESFVKTQNRENDVYGKIYAERKALETERNERGEYADQAAYYLKKFNYGKETGVREIYEHGKLSKQHLHMRAKRYAVKLFLSHYQYVAWEVAHGEPPEKPYVIRHLGHVDFISPPFWPLPEKSMKTKTGVRKA